MSQRTIKFRAWNGEEIIDTGVYHLTQMPNKTETVQMWDGDKHEYIELMQFTGLLDKNGKEIYENDVVVKVDGWIGASGYAGYAKDEKVKVEWNEDIAGFFPFANYDGDCGVKNNGNEFEIIGNIYENPELLKE